MSSGGKGGGASRQPTYDYFGTVAGVIRVGRIDTLHAIEADGKVIWSGPLARGSEDYVDLTSSIDASNFLPGGYCRVYWGTETQTADSFLAAMGHSAYRGVAYIVLRHFLFGRERQQAREIHITATAKPVADVSLVAAEHNVIDDGQSNPAAALVELLTAPYGLGLAVSQLHAASWLAAAARAYAERERTFCAPMFTAFSAARSVIAELALMCDLASRWRRDGQLEAVALAPGEVPDGVLTLDARHAIQGRRPKLRQQGTDAIPTSARVTFTDRDKLYKETPEEVPHAWAFRHRGVRDPISLSRPHVTRRAQARALAARELTRLDQPAATIEGEYRREIAKHLLPGDKVLIDVDPEPGGSALAQLAIIHEISGARTGPVRIRAIADTLAPVTAYTPGWAALEPQAAEAPPIAHALALPLPPGGFGTPCGVALLATRSNATLVGFRVFFDRDSAGDFPELGQQTGFAVRGSLTANIDENAETVRVQLVDGAAGPDAYLAGRTPESETAARGDQLLLILANVDGDGRIVVTDGRPELEFLSIVARTAVTADTHDYTVLRARRGLTERAWTTDAQAWIVPMANLTAWRHPDMTSLLAGGIGYFRLTAYNAVTEDDTTPAPEFSFTMPAGYDVAPRLAWTSPAGSSAETDSSGDYTVEFTATDRQGDLIALRVESRRWDGSAWVAETIHLDAAFAPTDSETRSLPLNFAGDATLYRTYQLTVIARDRAGNQTVEQRTIVRPPTGAAATPPPPTFNPLSDSFHEGYLDVTINAVSPATQIHWVTAALGSGAPTGSYYVGTVPTNVPVWGNVRIWARASDGANHSPWVCADYYRLINGGGGPIEP